MYHDSSSADSATPRKTTKIGIRYATDLNSTNFFDVEGGMLVGKLVHQFGIKVIEFSCESGDDAASLMNVCAKEATEKTINAFQVLMAGGRQFVRKKSQSPGFQSGALNAKDVLYNRLVEMFVEKKLDFPKSTVDEGQYLIQDKDRDVSEVLVNIPEATFPLSGQTAHGVVHCVECCKPRVYYSKYKLSSRQNELIAIAMSELDYTCGSPLSNHEMLKNVFIRASLTCGSQVEFPFYSSDFGKADICAYCGDSEGYIDAEMKKKCKTVLPICDLCRESGKVSICKRPYGKD